MAIYLIVVAGTFSFTNYIGSRVLMSLYALELGASALTVGLLISLYALCPFALSVHAGRLIDRFGSLQPLLLGSAGAVGGLAIPWFFPGMAALYVAAALLGLAFTFISVAQQALVSSLGDAAQRPRNVALHSLGISVSAFAGPLLVGATIDHWGHRSAFLLLTLLAVASGAGWMALRGVVPDSQRHAAPAAGARTRDLLRLPDLRRVVLVSALTVAGVDLYSFYLPIYGHGVGHTATTIGVILSAFAVSQFIVRAMMPALMRRLGEDRLLGLSLGLAGATFALFPLFEAAGVLMLLSFVLGFGLGIGQPLSIVMIYDRAPRERIGEALGIRFTVVNLMHLVIPAVFGAIASVLGGAPLFLANAALMFGGAWASGRRQRAQG